MKTLTFLVFVGVSFFACNWRSLNQTQKLENGTVISSPTAETDDCKKEDFKHKSEAEIAAMNPAQRIDEMVKDQTYHMPAFGDDYGLLIEKYIKKDGVKVLPVLTAYMNAYDPNIDSKCKDRSNMRFIVASGEAALTLDDKVIRLRGTKEGQSVIEALERGIERMKIAGFDKEDHRMNSNYKQSLLYLKQLKGINISDEIITDTLRVRHKIQMTEAEVLEFSNFLTSLDPTYPSWSEVGDDGPPYIMAKSEQYYESYLKFKNKR